MPPIDSSDRMSNSTLVAIRLRRLSEALRACDRDALAGECSNTAAELLAYAATIRCDEQQDEPERRKPGRPRTPA